MKYVITYRGDVADKIPKTKNSSHWLNTDGNTVHETSKDLGELSPPARLLAIRTLTSSVTAQARKTGQVLLMEINPDQ